MGAGAAANPDVPLLALTTAVMVTLERARRGSAGWLLLAGLLAGLACCAKYFGLLLALPLLHAAWIHPGRRLALPGAAAACALGAAPVVLWNATHGWASLAYHLDGRHTRQVGPSLENLAKLLGGQLAYISPLLLLGLGAAAYTLWRRRQPADRALLLVAAPQLVAGYLLILAVPNAEPHWPAAGYLPLVVALAVLLPGWLQRRRVRVMTWIALGFSALVALAFHLHVMTDLGLRMMPRRGYQPRFDLSNELRGWPRVADELARQLRARPGGGVLVAGCHYTTCAQLSFAARGRFQVICPSPRLDQFDFFPGGDGAHHRGVDLIYLRDERFPFDARQMYRCRQARPLSTVLIRRAGRVVRRFELQLCAGFDGLEARRWPPG